MPGFTFFASAPCPGEAMFPENAVILPEQNGVFRRETWRQNIATFRRSDARGYRIPATGRSQEEGGSTPALLPLFSSIKFRARKMPGFTSFASAPCGGEAMFPENTVILPEQNGILRRESGRQYGAAFR